MSEEEHDILLEFPSFRPMFDQERYYSKLLNFYDPWALEVAGQCLQACRDPYPELKAMMKYGWRTQLAAAASLLYGKPDEKTLDLIWGAFDADSWVTPQLAVLLSIVDPRAVEKMKKRLLLGCPVKLAGQEDLSPMERHVMHGKAAIPTYSDKAWSALSWRMAMEEETMEWMLQRFGADEAWRRLLDQYGYEGASIANSWHRTLGEVRPDLGLMPALESGEESTNKFIARSWLIPEKRETYSCPLETVEELFQRWPDTSRLLAPLFKAGRDKGDHIFDFAFNSKAVVSKSAKVPLSEGLRDVILDYLPIYYKEEFGILEADKALPETWIYRLEKVLRLKVRSAPVRLEGRISLTRDRLENTMTDAICYGAKDTGEMGGGAAMAVYLSCGPEVREAAREALAQTDRQIGDVVYTHAYSHPCSIYVGHIISIKTRTAQGDWCPDPERLGQGVYRALAELPERAKTVAFSCLATGEGRARPEEIAQIMMGAARAYFRDHPESEAQVLFSLPDYEDYEAFQKALT